MQNTPMPAARWTFPDLAHVEALTALHASAMPHLHTLTSEVAAWLARRDELAAELRRLEAELRPLLCAKCNGNGLVQWRRFGGECFTCHGDGWSAKGRKAARAAR